MFYEHCVKPVLGCTDCRLHLARKNITFYRGTPDANFVVIGEAPGSSEDIQGKPMTGRSGSYLIKLLYNNGFDLYHTFITNTVMCRPPDNRNPYADEITACSKHVNKLLFAYPRIVYFAVGKFAVTKMIPEYKFKSLKECVYKEFRPPWLKGGVVIPIYHPSYILRNPSLRETYENCIKNICGRAKDIIDENINSKANIEKEISANQTEAKSSN